MKFAIGSVQGPAHKKSQPEVPRQDSGVCFLVNDDNCVGIVSDGAGSSKNSHIASNLCVIKLAEVVKRDFDKVLGLNLIEKTDLEWDALSKTWFTEVRDELLKYCAEHDEDSHEYYCTLILVIKTKDNFFACNVGDGRAGGKGQDGVFPIIVPFRTFTVGATYFVSKEDWARFFRSYVLDSRHCDYFFISTDGPQDYLISQDPKLKVRDNRIYEDIMPGEVYYDTNLLYQPFFEGVIDSLNELSSQDERNERLSSLLEFGEYKIRGEKRILNSLVTPHLDDDKTLIVYFN
jgi:hypothetical protein